MFKMSRLLTNSQSYDRPTNTEKYYVNTCQRQIREKGTTEGWITVIDAFKKIMDPRDIDIQKSQILHSKLEQLDKNIVVKIGDNMIRREYEIGKLLWKCKGFIKFICFFTCLDDFRRYFSSELAGRHLCNGVGETMSILVMPYFPLGSITKYRWNSDNIHVLKSCISQACLSYISAYEKHNFVHRDFHPANILIKSTKQNSVQYELKNYTVSLETFGFRTWIMDFENSTFENVKNAESNVDFCQDFNRFFMLMSTFMPQIDQRGLQQIAINFTLSCEKMRTAYRLNVQSVIKWINDFVMIR